MSLRRWSVVGTACAAVLAFRCAGSVPAPSPGPRTATPAERTLSPTAVPAIPLPSGAEAEAALLELEDRRAFDGPLLSGLAGSPDAPTRSRVALALGRIGDARTEAILRELLRDSAAQVRAMACFAAGLMPGGTLTADVIPLLSDSDNAVAIAAAKGVAFLGRPEGEDALVAAIPLASPERKAAILRSLWRFSNPASEGAALPYAADSDPRVRFAALYALSRKPQPGSLAALTAALSDENADTAAMAARGLGVLGRAESVGPLSLALDGRPPLAINALLALELVFEKSPGATMMEERRERVLALSSDANVNVAVSALALLRQFAATDREAGRRLWSIALSGEGRRRQIALESLAAALGSGAAAAVTTAASSPDRLLRAAAAEAAASLAPAEARAWRDRFAGDREVGVRLTNLGTLKTAAAVRENRPVVNSALTDPDAGVRAAAVDALALLEDPSVLPLFADAERRSRAEAAPDVAISVIGACEKLHADPGSAALLEEIARGEKTLPARLARRSLQAAFGRPRDPSPAPEYVTKKTRADYLALLEAAKRPWRARVETSAGAFTIRLAGNAAPLTVMNFVALARSGYFDGVVIHRVVPNFVLQDGDPTATGNGGPGWEIRDEINTLEYGRGAVGMALSGPDTGGSQWFVTHSPQTHLNGLYTIFGQVSDGQSTVERIGQGERILRIAVSEGP